MSGEDFERRLVLVLLQTVCFCLRGFGWFQCKATTYSFVSMVFSVSLKSG